MPIAELIAPNFQIHFEVVFRRKDGRMSFSTHLDHTYLCRSQVQQEKIGLDENVNNTPRAEFQDLAGKQTRLELYQSISECTS